ncbi:peptide MFS transporter [Psychrobium sp. nBUS_13]|uniref:peptide MFS transporter n=1 Tax=Psychrobium sp. nBUS_13 TaxID=3395319 RepID=UPI003EBCD902
MNDTTSKAMDTGFFGHPKGLGTLFITEMWERMSYYGMRALLVLFMTASMQDGGLAFAGASATAIYGLYTGMVYFMGLPGGWISDRLIGGQQAVWYGGIIIMLGHIILAIPVDGLFFVGLIVVVLGTGLLKPNIAAIVGQLYKQGDERRDAGFAIYYMGINMGSIIGYFICGYFQEDKEFGWHWAFGAAAVGMAIGLVLYKLTQKNLNGKGAEPTDPLSPSAQKKSWYVIGAFLAALATVTYLAIAGTIVINPIVVAYYATFIFSLIFVIYYTVIYRSKGVTPTEKKGLMALLLICVASTFFWAGFEQAGSTLNLFAQDYTNRLIGSFTIPTAWFQSANAWFIVILSPFFAALWIKLGQSVMKPSSGLKCAAGVMIMASGFVVMFFAAQYAASGLKVAPYWLIATYFLHTVGELCLSPIALSAVSKLSPKKFAGQMMGVFVLTYSIGNIVSGLIAGLFFGGEDGAMTDMSSLYLKTAMICFGIGAFVLLFAFKTKAWEFAAEEASSKVANKA